MLLAPLRGFSPGAQPLCKQPAGHRTTVNGAPRAAHNKPLEPKCTGNVRSGLKETLTT
jgi:hypothetical protein